MTELANWVAGAPTPMPGNYNARRRLRLSTRTIRAAIRATATFDGRPALQTGGSSSGVGTAANFWAANVGTETSGSILSPSNQNMLGGDQADGRPRQPLRRDSDHRRSGHAGPDGEDRHRRGDHARRAGRRVARSERSGDDARARRPPGRDYTQFLEAGRAEGRAHRHSARVLLRPRVDGAPATRRGRAAGCSAGSRRRARWTRRSPCSRSRAR